MTVTHAVKGAETVVSIIGSVRVQEADALARELKGILSQLPPVVILDLTSVEGVDVTFFQILLAFQQSLVQENRRLVIGKLTAGHPVGEGAELVGLELKRHFSFAEDGYEVQ